MKRLSVLALLGVALLAGCASPPTLKSPCVGAPGSPCERVPLPAQPIEVPA